MITPQRSSGGRVPERITKFTPKQIVRVRTALGMTQVEFAKELGVGPSTVPKWENGYFKPSKWLLPELQRAARKAGFEA
jgi:DNA-binding transcriptional regulator YiaG